MTSRTFKPSQNLARKKVRSVLGTDAILIVIMAVISSTLILAFEYVLTKFGGILFLITSGSILIYHIIHQRKMVESLSYELTNAGIIIRSGRKNKSVEIISWDSIDSYHIYSDKLDKQWGMRTVVINTNNDEHKGQILEGLSKQEAIEIESFIENKLYFGKPDYEEIKN